MEEARTTARAAGRAMRGSPLAREDIANVLENLENQGYHLQMPPAEDEYIEHLPEELLRRNDPV